MRLSFVVLLFGAIVMSPRGDADDSAGVDTGRGDELVSEYFRLQTKELTDNAFADIHTLEDWQSRRGEYRRQLFEMLGLDPLPERTALKAVVTGQARQDDVIVENLHFQSRPGLYVTANLYRPAKQTEPLPAVLYVCGHGAERKNGVSYGNKTHYQHHGAWFARNGYVCLMIDTIQLGELEGIHHGTYREKMWWWNNRGYSSAAAEAWNCIRSLDYLQSRDEVDGDRIGVTGRSGGGAYSWWVAALDDRIKAAVPVAGITSLHNHVVDGCVEGHCDCMYMVNTYRWDYPLVAALVAPRPLLISNSDKDGIFPLDGVIDVHAKVRKIYELYDAGDKLGLQITEGPHKDTQELRVHAFRWLNRFLKNSDALIEQTAVNFFQVEQLKVFDRLPADERVTTIHETFVPAVSRDALPQTRENFETARDEWMKGLNEKTFRSWPHGGGVDELAVTEVANVHLSGVSVRKIEFTSQKPYRLAMYVVESTGRKAPAEQSISISVLAAPQWKSVASALAVAMPEEFGELPKAKGRWQQIAVEAKENPEQSFVYVVPRGVGPTEWNRNERKRTQIRRRFMQLGQTAATMQIWDVRRALQALDQLDGFAARQRDIQATGDAAVWSLYASLFEPRMGALDLHELPTTNRAAPDLLNVSRVVELTGVLMMAADHAKTIRLSVAPEDLTAWQGVTNVGFKKPGTAGPLDVQIVDITTGN